MEVVDFLQNRFGLTVPHLIQLLLPVCRKKCVKKNQYIIQEGDEIKNIFLMMNDGIARGYYTTNKGSEITDYLFVGVGEALQTGMDFSEPSPVNIQALTNLELVTISVQEMRRLSAEEPELLGFCLKDMQKTVRDQWELKVVSRQPALERYKWFVEKYPGAIDRIPERYVASFLDMTPETLSRKRGICKFKEGKSPAQTPKEQSHNKEARSARNMFLSI